VCKLAGWRSDFHHFCSARCSPCTKRAAIALTEKGVPFERATISLAAKPDWFTAISPLGKVPLLRVPHADGTETVLFESNVICEWVEDTQSGPRLHPEDPLERALHLEFGSPILSDLWGLETTQDRTVFEAKRSACAAKFACVENALGDGPFFAGERFSFVDAVFGPVFRYFDTFDALADLGALPRPRGCARGEQCSWRRRACRRRSGRITPSSCTPFLSATTLTS
jgi:glutathione S-transferase